VKGFAGAFLEITGIIYILLMTNLMIAVTCLPVWVFALLIDIRASWLWLAVTSILLAPALAGAYAVFKDYSLNRSTTAVRTYFSSWWKSWRRVGLVGLGFQVFFLVVGLDFYAMRLWGYGAWALPAAVVLVAVGSVTAMVAWVGLADRPDLKRRDVLKVSLYLAIRKPGWSLLTLVLLVVLAMILWASPALGLGITLAPGLYVVWGNSRRTLLALLPESDRLPAEAAPVLKPRTKAR